MKRRGQRLQRRSRRGRCQLCHSLSQFSQKQEAGASDKSTVNCAHSQLQQVEDIKSHLMSKDERGRALNYHVITPWRQTMCFADLIFFPP